MVKRSISFLVSFIACSICCSIIWSALIDGRIYNCTDNLGFGYLAPGDWIHGEYIFVDQINTSDTMDKPDSIVEGWSTSKLWDIWWTMLIISIGISLIFSWKAVRTSRNRLA